MLLKLSKWSILLLAFTPLIVDTKVFFPFVEGKTVFIRILVTLALVFLTAHFFYQHKSAGTGIISGSVLKNPLFISVLAFFTAISASVIFAVDKYRAFFGDVERGEGFVGLFFLFAFFVLAFLIFEKNDWKRFFWFSLATGAILFLHGAYQYFIEGIHGPPSFTGNRIYLGGYFLFFVFSGLTLLVLNAEKLREKTIILFSVFFVLAGFLGVLLSDSRGPFVGFAVGIVAAVIYSILIPLKIGDFVLKRKVPLAILALLILFASAFWITRTSEVWQNAPVLARLAGFSFVDRTTQTRLISWGVALESMKPANVGWGRFLTGWGQENYRVAYNSFYNPEYMTYEQAWFDRAHNKVLDVLVMNGILGFIAYLAVWSSALYLIFKRRSSPLLGAAALFFAVAYFVQNLVAFDSLVTYIPFFGFLAFLSTQMDTDKNTYGHGYSSVVYVFLSAFISVIAVSLLIWATLIPYFQMRNYTRLLGSGLPVSEFVRGLDSVLSPYTYAQDRIRLDLLNRKDEFQAAGKDEAQPIVEKALSAMRELIILDKYEPRYFMNLGRIVNDMGLETGNPQFLKEAEGYFRAGLEIAPKRQELMYLLASNLVSQKRFDEAYAVAEEMLAAGPDVPLSKMLNAAVFLSSGDPQYIDPAFAKLQDSLKDLNPVLIQYQLGFLRNVYNNYLIYFYKLKDEERFAAALETAYKLEKEWRAYNQSQFAHGYIKEVPPDRVEDMAKTIEEFKVRKWDAIEVVE